MNEQPQSNSLTTRISPVRLAAILLVSALVVSVIQNASSEDEAVNLFPYLMTCSVTLLYAVFTSVSLVTISDIKCHWGQAMIGFVLLLLLGIAGAYIISGVFVIEAASYYTIYSVVTIGYLVFLSIMRGVRFVIDYSHRPNMK